MLSIKGLVSVSWPRAEPNPEMLKLTATPKNEARKALKTVSVVSIKLFWKAIWWKLSCDVCILYLKYKFKWFLEVWVGYRRVWAVRSLSSSKSAAAMKTVRAATSTGATIAHIHSPLLKIKLAHTSTGPTVLPQKWMRKIIVSSEKKKITQYEIKWYLINSFF